MRKGCLFIVAATLLIIGATLRLTRSQTIERGLRLDSFNSEGFIYNAWSCGNWIESRKSGVHVSTYAPPYTLVVAVQPHRSDVKVVELLSASIIGEDRVAYSVLDRVRSAIEQVEARPRSGIGSPYAAFTFESVLESIDDTSLELKFRVGSEASGASFTQSLEFLGFEKKTRSFTFLDAISGV